jgi:hypothetical protein
MSFIVNDLLHLSRTLTSQGGSVGNFRRVQQIFHDPQLFTPPSPVANHQIPPFTKFARLSLNFSFITGILIFFGYFAPSWIFHLWPQLNPTWVKTEVSATTGSNYTLLDYHDLNSNSPQIRRITPIYDLSLPSGKWLKANQASIEAEIFTNASINDQKSVDHLLQRGLYLYPNYQTFGISGKTAIIAGHHYNNFLSPPESKKNFQNLNKVKIGDKLEIIDDHQKWTYEVFMIEQSTQISHIQSDLILYTCVWWWNSDLRLFVYARLLDNAPSTTATPSAAAS